MVLQYLPIDTIASMGASKTITSAIWQKVIDDIALFQRSLAVYVLNSSGVALAEGDVVVLDDAADGEILTTTTIGDSRKVGVVQDPTISVGAFGYVAIHGHVPVLRVASATARQADLQTSATAKSAQEGSGSTFGVSLSASAGAGTIEAFIHNSGVASAHAIKDLLGAFAQRANLQFATDLRVLDDPGGDASVVHAAPSTVAAAITTAGAATLTAAQLLGHLILRDPNGASRSDTTPTAALLVAAMPSPRVNDSVVFTIRNTGGPGEGLTLLAGTGATLSGTMTIGEGETRQFVAVLTNVGGGTEAYTVYALTSDGAAAAVGAAAFSWAKTLAFR